MPYSRFLDLFMMDNFHKETFADDVAAQRRHQEDRNVAYAACEIDPLSIRRNVKIEKLEELIGWVCGADSDRGGKIRINAHGGQQGLSNNKHELVTMEALADYLKMHGLTSRNMGDPGLKTVNLAACWAAAGPKNSWLIKKMADTLAMPGVKFTGAAAVTSMEKGVLMVKYEPWVPPALMKHKPYKPPAMRRSEEATARFAGSIFKKEYVYRG